MNTLLDELQHYQRLVLDAVDQQTEQLFRHQLHPDLSPIGWHLGHCIFTENYWIREKLLRLGKTDDKLSQLYQPTRTKKHARGERLPTKHSTVTWAADCQRRNLISLKQALKDPPDNELMRNDFLIHFLIQHYCQHFETINIVLAYQSLDAARQDTGVPKPIKPLPLSKDSCRVAGGAYRIGATHHHHPYDNEYPPHQVRLGSYRIGLHPVSNGEYQQFVDERAYENRRYWSRQGWQWRQTHQIRQPHYWLRLNAGGTPGPTDPVCGISYYEAEAYANWAQARLPHEYEWELACKKNLLQAVGKVWEWCANAFSPYQGFKPFPYAGYSQPYFDDNHYILKGGSYLTQAPIKRPSFRNYYQPDKRHQFAGVRLVFD